jgi:Flp pilus assembly pilin Flp
MPLSPNPHAEPKNLLARLWNEESGQDLVEYGLLIALVAVAAIASIDRKSVV